MPKMSELVDIGANLTHESFTVDLTAVIERAVSAGVTRLVVTGADLTSSRAAADLAARHPRTLWSTAGVHPHHAGRHESAQRPEFLELLRNPAVVAVGECGLDYFRDFSPRAAQRAAFAAQLAIAQQTGKPVFLHQRDAHADFMAILREAGPLAGGVAHCFTGGRAELEDYLGLGLHIGVTGWLCDERRGAALREALPHIPTARLMIETDAPYLLPRDLTPAPKSRRNEPAFLPHIAAAAAALLGLDPDAVGAMTTHNARALFGL